MTPHGIREGAIAIVQEEPVPAKATQDEQILEAILVEVGNRSAPGDDCGGHEPLPAHTGGRGHVDERDCRRIDDLRDHGTTWLQHAQQTSQTNQTFDVDPRFDDSPFRR